jgi:hypothetical protein
VGLQAKQGTRPQLTPAEAAWAEHRRLTQRQRDLPELMRDAAKRGAFQLVAQLRIELDQMPARLWAAEYTAVHSEIEAALADRSAGRLREVHALQERAALLAQEVRR